MSFINKIHLSYSSLLYAINICQEKEGYRVGIAVDDEGKYLLMYNPEIVKCSGQYDAEEGCLSLSGVRPAKRYQSIKVRYQNEQFQVRLKTFTGWTAQIIQHEIDHCNGILI